MTAGDVFTAESIQLWIYNGNGRAEKMIRSFEESEFQATLAGQHSKDYEQVIGQYAAALGARGDYFMLKVPLLDTPLGTATATAHGKDLFIDFMDILGVPADVQLAKRHGYAKYSPFDSPDLKVSDEMKAGIESEHLSVLLNNAVTTTTYVSMLVHGEEDARLQGRYEAVLTKDVNNEFWLRLKPTGSNVFLIRYDSSIWVLPAVATTGNGFVEISD